MTAHRLIFLDFDGVLNSYRTVFAYAPKNGWDPKQLDEVSIHLVKRLCELADAEIVISSTWREHFSITELTRILMDKGWSNPPIIGRTPILTYKTMYGSGQAFRGNEVAMFLDDFVAKGNELESWVILDDNSDFYLNETSSGGFRSNQPLVKTNEVFGMTVRDFYLALKYLVPMHNKLTEIQYYAYEKTASYFNEFRNEEKNGQEKNKGSDLDDCG